MDGDRGGNVPSSYLPSGLCVSEVECSRRRREKKKRSARDHLIQDVVALSFVKKEKKKKDAPNKFRLGVCWRVEHRDLDPPAVPTRENLLLSPVFLVYLRLSLLFSELGEKEKRSRLLCVRAGTIPEKAINLQAIFMIIYTLSSEKEEKASYHFDKLDFFFLDINSARFFFFF